MSLKILYSDLHIRPERMRDCEKVLDFVFTLAMKLRDKQKREITMINGGDTFNTRGVIRTQCFDVLSKHYRKWLEAGLKHIILVGNHDQEDRAGDIHPMRVFADSSKEWHVVDKPVTIGEFACFPYMNRNDAKDYIKANLARLKGKDALVHWGIRGAMMNDHRADTDGVPVEWLKCFRNVFSGHYHFRNRIANVQYIGSPMQQSFAEASQPKGCIIYDQKKNGWQFVEIKGTARYKEVDLHVGDLGEIDLPKVEVGDGDYCKVRITGDAEACAGVTRDFLRSKFPGANLVIERNVRDKHFSRLDIKSSDVIDIKTMMDKYVGFVDTDLDRKQLLERGMELVNV